MSFSVGIVGAGIIGRLLALKCHQRGWKVTLFDRDNESGKAACSMVPPAMLAPYCELDVAEKSVAELGVSSLTLWPEIIKNFNLNAYFQQAGSLVIAHPNDTTELERFQHCVISRAPENVYQNVRGNELSTLEPDLDRRFLSGLYFPTEGQIDSRGLMASTLDAIRQRSIECRFECEIQKLLPYKIWHGNEVSQFDIIFDCRGYGAANDIKDLRAVRGEIIRVHSKDVHINRPIRLLHPRWPLYVVPRPNGHYIIGASVVEAEDLSPISIRSVLEILSTAFSINSAFSEARILETSVGLRPAYPNNEPRLRYTPGLISINGMYRHGYLLSPIITDWACDLVENGKPLTNDYTSYYEAA